MNKIWREAVELEVPESGLITLPPELDEAAGLVTGDILCLHVLNADALSLEIYRTSLEQWGYVLEYDRRLWHWITVLLNKPMTAVEPRGIPIPAEVFPLAAGERVTMHVFSHWGFFPVSLNLWRMRPKPLPR
ncbi:MAG TPA: hypothetical protein VGX68_02330 [Thermoanaerobaculia bacterium]|nr:hypothetical protein [Thermoanaerobaculia bacterium]